jgi:uncharacterized protein (TIGR02453 family)
MLIAGLAEEQEMSAERYARFNPETITFLVELKNNNNRDWFNANKTRYEEEVLDVALRFIQSMQDPLAEIAPRFTAIPKRMGGSLMRVYRDTRFSKNKTPYKTNIGIQFRHEQAKDVHAPGYYVHIDPDQVFLGAGMWRPASDALRGIRERIADKPAEWERVRDDKLFKRHFKLGGEALTRPPRGFDKEHPQIADIRRKDFIAVKNMTLEEALNPRFQQKVETAFKAASDYMAFLCKAVNVPF